MERRVGIKKNTHQDALTYSSCHWISALEHKAPRTTGSKKKKKMERKKLTIGAEKMKTNRRSGWVLSCKRQDVDVWSQDNAVSMPSHPSTGSSPLPVDTLPL